MKIDERSAVMQKIIDSSELDRLLAIVTKLDDQTRAEVLKAINSQLNIEKKNFHLASIRRIVKASDTEIKDWIVTAIVDSYAEGANVAYADLQKLGVDIATGDISVTNWTADKIRQLALFSVQKDAVNALISDTYLDFGNGMNGLVKGAEHVLNDALKRQTRAQIIAGQITGTSIRDISKEIRTAFESQGFTVLIDRGGHSWSLKRYSDMLARTHIMKSANEGIIARMVAAGIDIVQVSTHSGACPICTPYEGKIYSLSGDSEKYPKMDREPPYHPSCRHRLLGRPDLSRSE